MVTFEEVINFFKNWPLTQKHLDVLGKNLYEDLGNIEKASFKTVQSMIHKWGSK